MAIYPIFIAVGLRQNCKQNYIFITVRLPYDVAKISPKSRQNLAKISPKSRQDCYTISPKSRQGCTTISPKSRQGCTTISPKSCQNLATVAVRCPQDWQNCNTISPQLQYDVPKTGIIAIRSRHSCTTMSNRLAGLQYDLATTTDLLRWCPQDLHERNAILCVFRRYSWTTMSLLRLAAWLLTTTLLATNFLLHQIKEKINITSY